MEPWSTVLLKALTSHPRLRPILDVFLKCALVVWVGRQIVGMLTAGPVLIALWQSGGTLMAWWLGFCSLAGIVLSVVVPVWIYRKVK